MTELAFSSVFVPDGELKRQAAYRERVRLLLAKRYLEPPLCHLHTFGCQGNVNDGEKLRGMLAEMGYGFTDRKEEAGLILYNTCAVREHAEDRVFGLIGELKRLKRARPDLVIGLCGCMIQQKAVAEKIQKSYPYVDLLFGTHELHRLPELLYEVLSGQKKVLSIPDSDGMIAENLPVRRENSFAAGVSIMYGCNNFCSYCIVPYVRGRERSRRKEDILREVSELADTGYHEIMLLGQNVNSYGKTLSEPTDFPTLLREINEIPGDFWVRFMTSHPKDATEALIDAMADCGKVCKSLHLPVQSGSDKVLRDMNRGYTKEDYLKIIRYAKKRMPEMTLSTDIIVGFPTETEADFADTLSLVREAGFDNAYTFLYSRRAGTRAAEWEDVFSPEEKQDRFSRLLNLLREIGENRYTPLVGQTKRVLVEGKDNRKDKLLSGRTAENVIVEFAGDPALIGSFVQVRVDAALSWAARGTLVE